MRITSIITLLGTFTLAGAGTLVAASYAVEQIENATEIDTRSAFDRDGLTWAEVEADGLRVLISGTAPNEALRFRAKTVASGVVDASRVIDQMDVTASKGITPPRFSIEILRNGGDISLIGLVPESMDRSALVARIAGLEGVTQVSDLLQSADYPVPEGWRQSLRFALKALEELPRSKISLSPQDVSVTAMTDSMPEKRQVETLLNGRAADDQLNITLEISAPRPIITPFTLRFVRDAEGARFDACSADTEAARRRILDAAASAGLEGTDTRCLIGLGVPSSDWGRAGALAIEAVGKLGMGSVTFSDADVSLIAAEGTPQALYDTVLGELENRLPEVYSLHAVLQKAPEDTQEEGTPEFVATLSPEGQVQLRGRVTDATLRTAIESLAMARFGSDVVHTAARLDGSLPEGWPVRVLTALDALALLTNGAVTVTPDGIAIRGETGQESARADIAKMFGDRLGDAEDFDISVTYNPKLDPVEKVPTAAECLARIQALQQDGKINFEPGSSNVEVASRPVLDNVAEVLRECPRLPLVVAGYTDSQGREEMNLALSRSRAQAVVTELRMRRVLTGSFEAVGFGEDDPIADNATAEGREANRRIEFRMSENADTEDTGTASGAGEAAGAATEGEDAEETASGSDADQTTQD